MHAQPLFKNELHQLKVVLTELEIAWINPGGFSTRQVMRMHEEFDNACEKARESWAFTAFTTKSDSCLKRYFSYHLQLLTDLMMIHPPRPGNEVWTSSEKASLGHTRNAFYRELYQSVDHLYEFFGLYLNKNIMAPQPFQEYKIDQLRVDVVGLCEQLAQPGVDEKLGACLLTYFSAFLQPRVSARFTYAALFYLESMVRELALVFEGTDKTEWNGLLTAQLTALNFNHLEFFIFRHHEIKSVLALQSPDDRLPLLKQQLMCLRTDLDAESLIYDPRCPALHLMIRSWIQEEIAVMERVEVTRDSTTAVADISKVLLDLSVAHLACLIRLFYEMHLFPGITLTDLFKFTAAHYKTKRQEVISWGGLSKEFYSISQVTAAGVRDLLRQMITSVDRQFFPVMAAIGIIICAR